MAKYILLTSEGLFARAVDNDDSKNHWSNLPGHGESITISDADYEGIIRNKKFLNASAQIVNVEDESSTSFSKEDVQANLNSHKEKIQNGIDKVENAPAVWSNYITSLNAINLDSISWPQSGNSWVDVLASNSISIPGAKEF